MLAYISKRLLLLAPTLFGIMLLNFALVHCIPGSPLDHALASMQASKQDALSMEFSDGYHSSISPYEEKLLKELTNDYGLDIPMYQRFWRLVSRYIQFDLGTSYHQKKPVIDLIKEKLPVSLSLGFWSFLLLYSIAIPLGIRQAVYQGSTFDTLSTTTLSILYAIPSFIFALFLLVVFAGGSYLSLFPLRGITSDTWESLTPLAKILDYIWHLILPVTAIVLSSLGKITALVKNAFLDELRNPYVVTARSKGLTRQSILYTHVLRNAMLPLIARFPHVFLTVFFSSNLLVEIVFSLDGLGLLGYEAILSRDYPVVFGSLYIFTLVSLFLHIIGDVLYTLANPRINFERHTT